jgi:hypothetical protein
MSKLIPISILLASCLLSGTQFYIYQQTHKQEPITIKTEYEERIEILKKLLKTAKENEIKNDIEVWATANAKEGYIKANAKLRDKTPNEMEQVFRSWDDKIYKMFENKRNKDRFNSMIARHKIERINKEISYYESLIEEGKKNEQH